MTEQYGFYFDEGRCVQCRTCELACKSVHDIEPGVKWLRVNETWQGTYPDVTRSFFFLACMHCENPACAEICPVEAITKRVNDGIVVVDMEKCNGCRECLAACPYDVPQFGADGKLQKCDFCIGLGREPACTLSCPADALSYGKITELLEMAEKKGKKVRRLDDKIKPSIVIVS